MGGGVSGLANSCNNILAVSDTEIYVCGNFSQPAHKIARWNGTTWSALGVGLYNGASGLEKDNNGNIYVSGSFTRLMGGNVGDYNRVAMWNGSSWNRIPNGSTANKNGFNSGCTSIKYNSSNNNIYFGGSFTGFYNNSTTLTSCNYTSCNYIASYDGTNLYAMGNPGGVVYTIEILDGIVYIGGNFTKGVLKWNGTSSSWVTVGNGLNSIVTDLKWNNNKLYAAGSFNYLGDGTSAAKYIAVFDGTEWNMVDNTLGGLTTGQQANAIGITSNSIYVGGTFNTPQNLLSEYS